MHMGTGRNKRVFKWEIFLSLKLKYIIGGTWFWGENIFIYKILR